MKEKYSTRFKIIHRNKALNECKKAYEVICEHFGVNPIDNMSRRRKNEDVLPKMIYGYYAMNNYYDILGKTEMAWIINRDHACLYHYLKTIEGRMSVYKEFKIEMEELFKKIDYKIQHINNSPETSHPYKASFNYENSSR